jgi:hypothetical protein
MVDGLGDLASKKTFANVSPVNADDECFSDAWRVLLGLRAPLVRQKVGGSLYYRNKAKTVVFVPAIIFGAVSALVHKAREDQMLASHESDSWFYLEHVFGAQVFMIVLGYFITMRMNFALNRWDSAYQGVNYMMGKWSDSHAAFVSFIEAQASQKLSPSHRDKLGRLHELITHYFSLLHAIALLHLSMSEGQVVGHMSEEGDRAFAELTTVPMPPHKSRLDKSQSKDAPVESVHSLGRGEMRNSISSNELADNNFFGCKKGWTSRLVVLGEITPEEQRILAASRVKIDCVMSWTLGLLSSAHLSGLMGSVPPPIYSRLYQEITNGMWGYLQAERVVTVPLPIVITQISNAGLIIMLCMLPFVMENTVQSKVLTPLLTFIISYSFMLIHAITNLLENPFGDDHIDLPLLEVHSLYNEKLLAGEPVNNDMFKPPDHVRTSSKMTNSENNSVHGAENHEKMASLSEFFSRALGKRENDPTVQELEKKCRKHDVTVETLLVAARTNCLLYLLDKLGVSLGQCVLLLQGVAEVEGLAHDTENTYGIEQNGTESRERSRSDEWTTRPRLSKLDSTTNLQEAVLIYLSQRESVAV